MVWTLEVPRVSGTVDTMTISDSHYNPQNRMSGVEIHGALTLRRGGTEKKTEVFPQKKIIDKSSMKARACETLPYSDEPKGLHTVGRKVSNYT